MHALWSSLGENIKKRVGRYLLQRYLGQYLLEKLTLDQLNVNLYNGTGVVTNVSLDCQALNAAAEQHNMPVEFKEGHLGEISVSVPWSSLANDNCKIDVTGMQITLQSKKRIDNGASMLESMWTSMASSMQLAEDCLKTSDSDVGRELADLETDNPMSGVEYCAQAIEAVLSRVKMCFRDTVVRVEHVQNGSKVGIAAEFHIKEWKYSDESSTDDRDNPRKYVTPFSEKRITLEGIECYSDIYKCSDMKESFYGKADMVDGNGNNLIRIARLNGAHTIFIKIKKDESIGGPQISLDCKFGSLVAFLSPIQAHILMKLLNELINPESESSGRRDGGANNQRERLMDTFDFKRVEEELQEQLKPGCIGLPGLQQQQGWSNVSLDESDDEFLPMQRTKYGVGIGNLESLHSTLMNNSTLSASTSMHQSSESLASTTANSQFCTPSKGSKETSVQGQIEMTQFTVSFASAVLILLHEDILSLSTSSAVEPSTVDKMADCSRTFFRSLGLFGSVVSGKKDLEGTREKLNSACSLSHMRLLGAPLKLHGLVSTVDGIPVTSGHLSLGFCDLVECLVDVVGGEPSFIFTELLSFTDNVDHFSSESIRILFKHKSYPTKIPVTKTTVRINMLPGSSELDISIISRINALLNPQLHAYINSTLESQNPTHKLALNTSHSTVLIKVISPSLAVNFRFPIPDCRAENDLDRIPPWIRNIRNDSVILQAKEFTFSTVLNSNSDKTELDFRCEEAQLYYKENENETPVLFAEARAYDCETEGASMKARGFDWPRVLVSLFAEKSAEPPETSDPSGEQDSLDSLIGSSPKKPSVFSSKRVVHESLGSNNDDDIGNSESVIPGDRAEMNEFAEAASRDTIYKVELNLRSLSVSLPSKHFFQELYNRFCNDLLLWESGTSRSFRTTQVFREFSTTNARSGGSDSEEEEMSAFYTPQQSTKLPSKRNKHSGSGQSEVAVYLNINKGTCSFFTPFMDQGGSVVPEQKGQVTLKVEQGTLFVVSGFEGNKNLGFVCLYANKAEFHHCDLLTIGTDTPRFGKHMKRTIYPSEIVTVSPDSATYDNSDMLAVAIKIDREPEKNFKTFKLAVSIRNGTLEHRVNPTNRSWLDQVIEFFDVTDTLISGYTPSSVLTELHLHLWNCAIDYSPLNLPLRSILMVQTFSISSNIVAQTNTKVIRFMSEDAALYISPQTISIDILRDYVCVMSMDFFELSLRRSPGRNSESPRIELKASNNVLHIRTCSDSCKALFNLIMYYASYGDLLEPNDVMNLGFDDKMSSQTPLREFNEPAFIDADEIRETESQTQMEHVNDLVAEAMIDSNSEMDLGPSTKVSNSKGTVELKFEPGPQGIDTSYSASRHYYEPIMQCADGQPVDINISDEDEEEFCILENDPGVGILSKNGGDPEARVLINEPVRLIENYFSVPLGRTDILKAPKHYPMPVTRYTLQDVSVIWHLYGGQDFPNSKPPAKPMAKSSSEAEIDLGGFSTGGENRYEDEHNFQEDQVDIGIDALNSGALFTKAKAFEDTWDSPKSNRKQSWENSNSSGGKDRRNDVCVELHLCKIKFQHEVYPDNTEQASRQVLVINNVEIRDRLQSSQFNKMLYLYTSATKPKQSHAHMVIIKAAHIRPDCQLGIEECCLKISLLPIRLNIDQDALLFLYQFYNDVSPKNENDDDEGSMKPPSHTPSVESLPVLTVNKTENDEQTHGKSDGADASNLLIFEESSINEDNISTCSRDLSIDSGKPPGPVYFRHVIFSPEVPIRLDYRGKRMDMTHGPLAGILMGLAQLNCLEVQLKKINHRHGILGLERLITFMIVELTNDIKKTQLPNLLGGVGPMYSVVQLFQGMRDLFWLPIEQYQKDGRIAKGLQRGANAFTTSAAMAALELTNRLVQTIQGAAEFTYDMVSPGPSVQQQRRQSSNKKKRHCQPGDIREGMTNAYHVVKEGLGDTAKTIVRVASKEHEQKGVSGAVGGVLRQIPPTVVRPIILVAEATSNVLGGFRSQLEPDFKKEAEEKWKNS